VSAVSFGAWAIGSSWGPVDDGESLAALHAAVDAGVNFIDTGPSCTGTGSPAWRGRAINH
jgi:aryl-alcohol dehydrogenase-like predicted oxidoreductase